MNKRVFVLAMSLSIVLQGVSIGFVQAEEANGLISHGNIVSSSSAKTVAPAAMDPMQQTGQPGGNHHSSAIVSLADFTGDTPQVDLSTGSILLGNSSPPPDPAFPPVVTENATVERTKEIMVPADTVINIALNQALNSSKNRVGETVQAKVTDPVYLGPYLAVPVGAPISGKITQINPKKDSEGRNPYIVVKFDTISLPGEPQPVPFSGMLIAYKSGLRSHEYLWKLPTREDKKQANIKSLLTGAFSGIFMNPLFGPPVMAGAALLRNTVVDGFARGGEVEIKPKDPVSISVGEHFMIPVADPFAEKSETALQKEAEMPAPQSGDAVNIPPPAETPVSEPVSAPVSPPASGEKPVNPRP